MKSAHGTGKSGWERRISGGIGYSDGKFSASVSTTHFKSGETSQRVGSLSLGHGNVNLRYENDGGFGIKSLGLGDGGDSHRTAAMSLSYKDYSVGLNLFTGKRADSDLNKEDYSDREGLVDKYGRTYKRGYVDERGPKYRLGALYVGYKGYRAGTNSEHVRHAIQDRLIHDLIKDGGFENQSWGWEGYFQYQSYNRYTLW